MSSIIAFVFSKIGCYTLQVLLQKSFVLCMREVSKFFFTEIKEIKGSFEHFCILSLTKAMPRNFDN